MTDNGAKALADAIHKVEGPLATIDPSQCIHGERDQLMGDAILATGAVFLTAEEAERLRRIETAGSILLSAVNVTMPEVSPYGCPHSRDWLNGMLDDLRAALTAPALL